MTINSGDVPNKNAAQRGLKSDRKGKAIPVSNDKPGNRPNKSSYNNPLQGGKVKRKNNGQN